jgi:hypothetical protein
MRRPWWPSTAASETLAEVSRGSLFTAIAWFHTTGRREWRGTQEKWSFDAIELAATRAKRAAVAQRTDRPSTEGVITGSSRVGRTLPGARRTLACGSVRIRVYGSRSGTRRPRWPWQSAPAALFGRSVSATRSSTRSARGSGAGRRLPILRAETVPSDVQADPHSPNADSD